jgi:thymidylate kinase
MAEGCNEKFDFEFIKWILWEGRSKKARKRYKDVISKYPKKIIVIKNQKQLDRYQKCIADLKNNQK